MNTKNLLKNSNSKGTLAKACLQYQKALSYYASEEHWAVKGEDIIWIKDDDPTLPAQVVLGMRKMDVRLPDKLKQLNTTVEFKEEANENKNAV